MPPPKETVPTAAMAEMNVNGCLTNLKKTAKLPRWLPRQLERGWRHVVWLRGLTGMGKQNAKKGKRNMADGWGSNPSLKRDHGGPEAATMQLNCSWLRDRKKTPKQGRQEKVKHWRVMPLKTALRASNWERDRSSWPESEGRMTENRMSPNANVSPHNANALPSPSSA